MKEEYFSKDYTGALAACGVCRENKGENIKLIDVSRKTSVADYFVLATSNSNVHAKSLVDNVEEELEKINIRVIRREIAGDGRWFVLDYGNFLVHIINADMREHYQLEKLWSEGKNTLDFEGMKKLISAKEKQLAKEAK